MNTVADLAQQVDEVTADFSDYSLQTFDVYDMLHAHGPANSHLRSHSGNPNPQSGNRERPLSGNEVVSGSYLSIDYIAHRPTLTLCEYATLEQLEQALLGDSGICNHFTTFMIPFVQFRYVPYTITFHDSSGNLREFDKRRQFDRLEQIGFPYLNRQIIWRTIHGQL